MPPQETQPVAQPPAKVATTGTTHPLQPAEISEDEVRRILTGKQLFLRGGYLDNTLSFNEHGVLIGRSPQGSYTLSAIEIDKVHMSRHKVELEGQRFALHFLGALPYEDPTKAMDRVNITPKKKVLKITIDREFVVKPKVEKGTKKFTLFASKNSAHTAMAPATAPLQSTGPAAATPPAAQPADTKASETAVASATAATAPAETADTAEGQNANEAQAKIAAAPLAERPADPKSVTTTTSQAHANKVLTDALDNVFAQGFDERMMASMPSFWKLYYDAVAAKSDYRPKDPSVLRQNMVDQKAKLTSTLSLPQTSLHRITASSACASITW